VLDGVQTITDIYEGTDAAHILVVMETQWTGARARWPKKGEA
jgi:hypothetical protein